MKRLFKWLTTKRFFIIFVITLIALLIIGLATNCDAKYITALGTVLTATTLLYTLLKTGENSEAIGKLSSIAFELKKNRELEEKSKQQEKRPRLRHAKETDTIINNTYHLGLKNKGKGPAMLGSIYLDKNSTSAFLHGSWEVLPGQRFDLVELTPIEAELEYGLTPVSEKRYISCTSFTAIFLAINIVF